eukprot:Rhum_TRINITY_DN15042_c11_g1::Rhum_TRINITY_DN15042_c11_g1_i2::g.137124::m.137124
MRNSLEKRPERVLPRWGYAETPAQQRSRRVWKPGSTRKRSGCSSIWLVAAYRCAATARHPTVQSPPPDVPADTVLPRPLSCDSNQFNSFCFFFFVFLSRLASARSRCHRQRFVDPRTRRSLPEHNALRDLQVPRLLPREARLGRAAEVAHRRGLEVDRPAEVELLDDVVRAQLEVGLHDVEGALVRVLARAVRVDVDRQRLGNADGVRQLHDRALGEAARHDRLGDPASRVARGPVHLRRVLAGERASAVRAPAAVRVHDDLAAGQAGVALRSADHEPARRVQVEDGLVVQVLGRDHVPDQHVEVRADLLVRHVLRVLRRDQHRVHAQGRQQLLAVRLVDLVLHRHLRLGVRARPLELAVVPPLRVPLRQLARQLVRQRHELLRLVRGVAEHEALVTGAQVRHVLVLRALRDVRRLLLDRDQHVARLVVESLLRVVVSDVLHRVAQHRLVVHLRLRRDLAEHHHHARLAARLARHLRHRVVLQARVEHGVRELVAHLVRVTLRHVLRREHERAHHCNRFKCDNGNNEVQIL